MKIQWESSEVTVFESSLYRTTSSIIGFDTSVIIVDPNWLPNEIETLQHFVSKNHTGKKQFLLFTHSDYDHIIGYGAFPSAQVIASELFVKNKLKNKILNRIYDFDNEYYITRPYPISYPDVDIIITTSGQKVNIDGHEIIFFLSPGHTEDGIFTIIPTKNCWIAGDYLSNIEIPFIDFDIDEYEQTLTSALRINEDFKNVNLLIPGHGDIANSNHSIKTRIKNDLHYIELLKKSVFEPSIEVQSEAYNHIINYSANPTLQTAHQKNIQKLK